MNDQDYNRQGSSSQQSQHNQDGTTEAVLAHILGLLTGFLVPLILFLVIKDKPFAKDQAAEALNFQITVSLAYLVSAILMLIYIGALLAFLVLILDTVFCIIAAVAASKGKAYRYPIAIRFVR